MKQGWISKKKNHSKRSFSSSLIQKPVVEKKEGPDSAPWRLAEAEIKSFKMEMVGVQSEDGSKNL